ncbi:MAG: S8 family serine peptidase [Candidatus Baltobacteraceae bacterium]
MYGRSTLAAGSALAVLALVTACGGGGGGNHLPAHPTPTPSNGPAQFACTSSNGVLSVGRRAPSRVRTKSLPSKPVTLSTYTYDSNPTGLPLTRNGQAFGATTKSDQPPFNNDPYYLTIKGGAGELDLCFSQVADGNHTLYYNSLADTTGTLAIGSGGGAKAVSSAAKRPAQRPLFRLAHRFAPRHVGPPQIIPDRIEVLYDVSAVGRDLQGALALERAMRAPGAHSIGPIAGGIAMRVVSVPAGTSATAFAATMRAQPGVRKAAPMHYRYLQSSNPFTPDDPNFDPVDQWDMYRINMPNAWGYTQGSRTIPIAIVDTGVDLIGQQDLQPIGPQGKVTFQESVLSGVVDKSAGAAQDRDGHGTNVAGIAAEDTNNSFGFAGVGFDSTIQAYRIFPYPTTGNQNPGAAPTDEAQAIYDAIANGAKVINLSLGTCENPGGGSGPDPIELAAVETAIQSGVVVVAAAGNERAGGGTSPCTQGNGIDYPAAYPGVIAVGASALNDAKAPGNPSLATEYVASYSNSGPGLSVVAPGGDPPANDNGSDPLHWISNLYSTTGALISGSNPCANQPLCAILIAGTSQATPHVSGAVALMLAVRPGMSPAQVKKIIQSTADNINDPNQGYGRLDVYRALANVSGDPNPPSGLNPLNFVAFAYTSTANKPNILDTTFPNGVPVAASGTFRVPDVPANAPAYKIGLWYDANGNGVVDAGDWFGAAGPCSASSPCSAASTITVTPFTGGPLP